MEDLLQAALVGAPVAWKAHINACWIADDGQVEQAADDVVAQYFRLPACGVFVDGLDGLGFNNGNYHRVLRPW
ncbi:hypothetical protein FRC0425_01717 [Corynebacterium diphtheriae]|nr:hypothetical protein FRC0425_01717 [Corynebacterium diphtheriae]